ncbi:MAG: ATP-binding cassette domain-containing protein, partial [Anaerolineae bacterium]|nr:ATP-binding cassette domain-containing protein [Anaerolineae bacterium]
EGIAGQIPALGELPDGCVFATRCPVAVELCHEERPVLESPIPGRRVRCHRWPEILAGEVSARREGSAAVEPTRAASDETALQLEGIEVHFPLRRSLREILGQKKRRAVKAVDGLSLRAAAHQTLGIVGESGSGKTSLARAVIGLAARTGGEMQLLGLDLPPKLNQRSRDTLRHLQIVFQNPEEALNPYLSIGESLSRPLITLLERSKEQAASEAVELLDAVGLPQSYALRFPGQLSGGEKQRVAIARAFAANPDLLLADEPVSALDVSVQASILNLLTELQGVHSTTTVFISHDIAVVAYLADEVAVMYLGKIMQTCAAGQLFSPPYHPYTEALLSAIPVPDPTAKQERIRLPGDIPSGLDAPTGCPFHTRCPRSLGEVCVDRMPPWQESEDGKRIFCHIPLDELALNQERIIVWEGGE